MGSHLHQESNYVIFRRSRDQSSVDSQFRLRGREYRIPREALWIYGWFYGLELEILQGSCLDSPICSISLFETYILRASVERGDGTSHSSCGMLGEKVL